MPAAGRTKRIPTMAELVQAALYPAPRSGLMRLDLPVIEPIIPAVLIRRMTPAERAQRARLINAPVLRRIVREV